jgi:hypothetical protein
VQCGLTHDLCSNRFLDEAKRVQVFEFGAGAEFRGTSRFERHVCVAAEMPLLEIRIGDAEVAQDPAQRAQVGGGLRRRAQIRLRDDLEQRHTGAVQVDAGAVGPGRAHTMNRLACILFHVDAREADPARFGAWLHHDVDPAFGADRLFVLGDLVALG